MKKIELTRGYYALVDDEDFEELNQFKWSYHHGYAVRNSPYVNGKRKELFMHRVILNTPEGMETDHINGIRWDNRRDNIRIVTKSQNQWNRNRYKNSVSKYKGVYWSKRWKRWYAGISYKGKNLYVGCFKCEEDAARAYDKRAKELHGEYARLNFK
jgi:hypothetical protein